MNIFNHLRFGSLIFFVLLMIDACSSSKLPQANDYIKLRRTPCFGKCSVYECVISGDGKVLYNGAANVQLLGQYSAEMSSDDVQALFEEAHRIDIWSMDTLYTQSVTDLPTTFISLRYDNRSKSIEDYLGAPASLKNFEQKIDSIVARLTWKKVEEHN